MTHIPRFEIQFSFSCEEQMKRAAKGLLDDDLSWCFSVTATDDSAERHTLEIHEMHWANNAARAARIVEDACKDADGEK